MEKIGRHHLNQLITVNITSNVMLISCTPRNDVMRTFHLCNIRPQNPQPSSNHGGNIRQTQIKEHSTKYLSRTLQSCQGHEKQEKTKEPSQIRQKEM